MAALAGVLWGDAYSQPEQTMDLPIRPKTEAEIEAERLAAERDRIDQLRTWDRHSALSAVVGERQKTTEKNHQG